MDEKHSLLKSLADKLIDWDKELDSLKNRTSEMTEEQKEHFNKLTDDVKQQAQQLKEKMEEYRKKSPDELKKEGEQFMRTTSGKIADGLKTLATFFESKSSTGAGENKPPEPPASS